MEIKMKELPISERPYEKLELYGESKLSNSELLAIIIKSGTKTESAITIATRLINLNDNAENNSLRFMQDISLNEFMQIKGIGRVKAIQLKALCELTKRISSPIDNNIQIRNSCDVANLLIPQLRFEQRELVKVLILNCKNIVLKIVNISERRY